MIRRGPSLPPLSVHVMLPSYESAWEENVFVSYRPVLRRSRYRLRSGV